DRYSSAFKSFRSRCSCLRIRKAAVVLKISCRQYIFIPHAFSFPSNVHSGFAFIIQERNCKCNGKSCILCKHTDSCNPVCPSDCFQFFYHGICRPNGLSKPGIPVVEWYNHTTKNLHLQAQKLISAARRTTTKPGFHASGFCIIHMSNQMISISYIHPACLPDKHS